MKILREKQIVRVLSLSFLLVNCGGNAPELPRDTPASTSPQNETLKIWWARGYYIPEDEALEAIVNEWQQQTGNKIELSFMSHDDILKDAENALNAGNPPDIVYSTRVEEQLIPRWAWNGKLADVSDAIAPLKEIYSPAALQSVSLYNKAAKKRSNYAIPIQQRTVHIHYWRDLLAEAGLREEDIPQEWDAFWQFWRQAQDNLRRQGREEIYSLGLPFSSKAGDTYSTFQQILEAYDIELLDEQGNLLIQNAEVRKKIIAALTWYVDFYRQGYVPPDAKIWTDGSNNTAFLNQKVVMTINPTLSIPSSQREEEEEIYRDRIATIEFPNEPDGEVPKYRVAVKQIALFAASPRQEMAKDFLQYFIQPEHLGPYIEGALGRYFPVMPQLAAEPFWNDPADPHISVAVRQFQTEKTRPSYQSLNPAYTDVQAENIWGQAIEQAIAGRSPEEAVDEAIARIEEIFAAWNR
ncbi:MAG: carbohydrate ABC transporter substrate-binding protein [Cyanobacteria bacterium SBLK]|nr:carbohydrate ABC transporter substrate-binding protein [Cyanobacteria bacterium SBLK]